MPLSNVLRMAFVTVGWIETTLTEPHHSAGLLQILYKRISMRVKDCSNCASFTFHFVVFIIPRDAAVVFDKGQGVFGRRTFVLIALDNFRRRPHAYTCLSSARRFVKSRIAQLSHYRFPSHSWTHPLALVISHHVRILVRR